jgi:hypothetical protein
MDEQDPAQLPVAGSNAILGHQGETLVSLAVSRAGHHYRPNSGLDFGIDGRIEILIVSGDQKLATGREIAVQSKRGMSAAAKTRHGRTHYFTEAHANYWLGHSLPVIVAHSSESDTVRWALVAPNTVRKTEHGYAIDLPENSDLASAGAELASLADPAARGAPDSRAKTLIIRISIHGDLVDDPEEVGLAALETSRKIIRGERAAVEVELEGMDKLIAEVDALADLETPDADARRRRIQFEKTLDAYRSKASFLTRATALLISSRNLMDFYGTDDRALAVALVALLHDPGVRRGGFATLRAWPALRQHALTVRFDLKRAELDDMLARNPALAGSIELGHASAFLVRDLPRSAIKSGLLPSLARRFVNYASSTGIADHEVLASTGVDLENWIIGNG